MYIFRYICIDLQPIVQIYIYLHIRCCLDDAFKMHFSRNRITPWKQISRFPLNGYDLGAVNSTFSLYEKQLGVAGS